MCLYEVISTCLIMPPFFQISLFNRIGSVQNFCSQSDLDTFHQFHCTGLAVKPGPQESLPEVCEGLIVSLSAQIHNGAVRK